MHRTRARLADGREIVYYDAAPGRVPAADPRDLPPVEPVCEVRRDPLTGDHVTITAHRNARTFLPPADRCPLCPGGPASEVPDPSYEVVAFENRFPSFDVRTPPPTPPVIDGVERLPGAGRCEVVCFTDEHAASMARLPVPRVRTVIDAWADRTAELSAIPSVAQVFVFENRGVEIGVTLHHPHGQIYAYPFVTPRTGRMLARAAARPGLFGEVLEAERAGSRAILSGEHWTAYVPAAARWPVEVHLMPHRHVPDLAALDAAERDELAVLYRDLLRRCDALYDTPLPYVAGWHQAPTGEGRDLLRLHLELFSVRRAPGKIKYLAGSESGMAAWINDVVPEEAAARLRAVTAG
ncbi:galactose-1-phosphate uridylyltransferase [Actinomadura sp. KC216]|uniref:galactose-1-phosphate uridylyltransferase n=1 Tax=Actinomadura sp. KC216 TaxID=2530370 RepID=UPI00104A15CA|nr:galactose-1-phosphate uridylyltransferase [Actinomadura sp. KC216]TDB83494.1 galactose-1-phosphate uridylyltransferase [Actinomadura sp. KC216]